MGILSTKRRKQKKKLWLKWSKDTSSGQWKLKSVSRILNSCWKNNSITLDLPLKTEKKVKLSSWDLLDLNLVRKKRNCWFWKTFVRSAMHSDIQGWPIREVFMIRHRWIKKLSEYLCIHGWIEILHAEKYKERSWRRHKELTEII